MSFCICSTVLGKESKLFCAENPARGIRKTLPLTKFQDKGFLEKDKLIIEVYINVVEAFDGEGEDITGFAAHVSQKRIYVSSLCFLYNITYDFIWMSNKKTRFIGRLLQ